MRVKQTQRETDLRNRGEKGGASKEKGLPLLIMSLSPPRIFEGLPALGQSRRERGAGHGHITLSPFTSRGQQWRRVRPREALQGAVRRSPPLVILAIVPN